MGGLAAKFGAWLLKVATGDFLGKVLAIVAKSDSGAIRLKELETQAQIAMGNNQTDIAKAVIAARASTQQSQMQHWPYWAFTALFIVPLGIWWAGVLLDSTFRFGWGVANLPQAYIRDWAGEMIRWLFYTGSSAMALRWAVGR